MLDDMPQAIMKLGRALSLGEPEGYVRTFVDEGAPMAALLMDLRKVSGAAFRQQTASAITTAAANPTGRQ
jgi:LuxR family maltose regulon positive regulatory protein